MPGVSRCVADNVLAVCDASGTRETITMCAGACVNGACVVLRNLVFVTSQAFVGGALGGLDGADDACTELAASAGISSRAFAAWLSDAQGSPSTRFARRDGPYALVDGTVVANDWIELTSGTLRHSIDLTELGGPPPQGTVGCVSPAVWSGTNDDGTQAEVKLGADCGDWNNPIAETAVFGWVGHTTRWSNACTLISGTPAKSCGGTAALYCFEQ